VRSSGSCEFEWRAPLGAWRWLLLGTLGVGSGACAGQSEAAPADAQNGANAGSSGEPGSGAACVGETVLEGGMRRCANGLMHRVAAEGCPTPTLPEPRRNPLASTDPRLAGCLRNADCTQKAPGQCVSGSGGNYCRYGCATDDDCGADQLCLCDGGLGRCASTNCHTDAECADDRLCASNDVCSSLSFGCQTNSDECAVDADCVRGQRCALVSGGLDSAAPGTDYRICALVDCAVPGRPFLVAGALRCAPSVERADWYSLDAAESLPAQGLTPELRAELRRGWAEQALMEHASVAAFARFVLQLFSLGAPADLVAAATTAMQDEIRHAQDCFRLARRHSDAELGPGPLPVAGALQQTDLGEVVLGTVLEGCIGETLAALEAAEALQHCEDPAARGVLERIAAEETRHAELAWRFVAWALDAAGETAAGLRRRIRDLFERELAAQRDGDLIGSLDRELARHGLLSQPVRQALRRRALAEVVAPCAQALLALRARRVQPALAAAGSC